MHLIGISRTSLCSYLLLSAALKYSFTRCMLYSAYLNGPVCYGKVSKDRCPQNLAFHCSWHMTSSAREGCALPS